MQIKSKTGRVVDVPTPAESAAIDAAIAADPDTFEVGESDFKRMRRGRPPVLAPKVPTTIRFDADVLAALKASGKGWQTRVNEAMREWVKAHSLS